MPACSRNISPDRWCAPPTPDEPKVSLPGSCRASAIRSCRFLTGSVLCTLSTSGLFSISTTGARSFCAS
ncbi:Uncharacterised protein [Bordetella pertussis]|nr:Uncharacterised protein [Bordetella pertussis]